MRTPTTPRTLGHLQTTRRGLLARTGAVGAALPAILLAACGPVGGSQAAGGQAGATKRPVKLAYWNKFGGATADAEDRVVANFQQRFPHITVQALENAQIPGSGGAHLEKFQAALAAGSPPEVVKLDRFTMGSYGAKQATTLLDDLIKRDKIDVKKYFPATVEEIRYPPAESGKITALPWNTDTRGLIVVKKPFVEAGLDPNRPPRTWDDAREYGLRLTRRQGTELVRAGFLAEGPHTNWNIGWHWAAGGQWLKPGPDGKPNRRAAFNDERARTWMQYIVDNRDSVLGGEQAFQAWASRWGPNERAPYYNDGVAMFISGNFLLGDLRKFGPSIEFGAAPPPRPRGLEGTPITWSGGWALAIPKGIKGDAFDASWEFVKYYCATKEAQLTLATLSGRMPVLMEAAEDKAYRDSLPLAGPFVDLMKYARIRDVTPAGDDVWFNDSANSKPFALFELPSRAFEKKMAISDILNESEKYVNRVLDEAWARAGG